MALASYTRVLSARHHWHRSTHLSLLLQPPGQWSEVLQGRISQRAQGGTGSSPEEHKPYVGTHTGTYVQTGHCPYLFPSLLLTPSVLLTLRFLHSRRSWYRKPGLRV